MSAIAPRFVSFEGGEAAGKSTQARLLAARLRDRGIGVVETREPGGAPGAEALRTLLLGGGFAWTPLAETFLHFAARAEHVGHTIRPALAQCRWVISDRYVDSTLAYQGWGQGADRAAIATLTALLGLMPDLTLVLDIDVPTSLARLRARGGETDRYERLGAAFFARVRAGFLAIAEAEPARCVVIPAAAAPETVAASVAAAVAARLGVPL